MAETDNDEIFSCAQIRVLTEFMWQHYYVAIRDTLFYPYLVYFISFVAYVTKFASFEAGDTLSWAYFFQMMCLVLFGKNFITFAMLEIL